MPLFKRKNRSRGQALVEFALVLPLLIILSMLIIQYGIIFYTTLSLTNLAREGARYGATQPSSDAAIKQRIHNVLPPNISWNSIKNDISISPSQSSSDRITGSRALLTVEIDYNMSNKLFLPATFFGIQIFSSTYTTDATMMVE